MNSKRPRILFLTTETPRTPGLGVEVRTYYFLRALTQIGDVTLISLGGGERCSVADYIFPMCQQVIQPSFGEEPDKFARPKLNRLTAWLRAIRVLAFPWRNGWKEMLDYCNQYCPRNQVPRTGQISKRWLAILLRAEFRLAARFFSLPTAHVFYFAWPFYAIWPEVTDLLANNRFDVVWFEHSLNFPFMEPILKQMPTVPLLVCNSHNIEWKLPEHYAALADTPDQSDYWRLQQHLVKEVERKAFRACDLVLTCSQQDKNGLADMAPKTDCRIVSNGVNTEYFQPGDPKLRSPVPTILYTGGFGYPPNGDAVEFFVREIFPLIKAKMPDCRFLFAGSKAQAVFQGLRDVEGVACVSNPEDIRPCFHQAWVVVVPLRAGGGTRLKILEAMAMERAIVSTRIGAEGIPCVHNEHIMLADTPLEFAQNVLRLLADESLRSRLGHQAGAWVRHHYDWKSLCANAMGYLQQRLPG